MKFYILEYEQYETSNIGGVKLGVESTHMIKYFIPFDEKWGIIEMNMGL